MLLVKNSNQVPSLLDRFFDGEMFDWTNRNFSNTNTTLPSVNIKENADAFTVEVAAPGFDKGCLLYTSPSPRDGLLSRMPSSA